MRLITASFRQRADAEAARAELGPLASRLGIEIAPLDSQHAPAGVHPLTVKRVSPRAVTPVRAVIARHRGAVVIDVLEVHLRR